MTFSAAILRRGWEAPDLRPGAYVALLSADEGAALDARVAGLSLRDTLLVLGPAREMSFAFLFRTPLSVTVAEGVLAHGTGVLNIDACRVASDMSEFFSKTGKPRSGLGHAKGYGMGEGYGGDRANPPHSAGRWPSNLAFIHAPGCQRIAAWMCTHDCQVASIDRLSGSRPSTLTGRADPTVTHEHPSAAVTDSWFSGGAAKDTRVYADAGGASRFFMQFANEAEFMTWLRRLLAADPSTIYETP